MAEKKEIEIPAEIAEQLLIRAAQLEISVEELVERSMKKYIERRERNG